MRITIIGRSGNVFSWLENMNNISDKGGGVYYRGRRLPGDVEVIRIEIPENAVVANIQTSPLDPAPSRLVYDHAMEFNWGYGGSGAAQLALALLLDATGDKETALSFHQEFKEQRVANWGTQWGINAEQVRNWVKMKQDSRRLREYFNYRG